MSGSLFDLPESKVSIESLPYGVASGIISLSPIVDALAIPSSLSSDESVSITRSLFNFNFLL